MSGGLKLFLAAHQDALQPATVAIDDGKVDEARGRGMAV